MFDYARTTPCVLFFDEFDAVGKERGDVNETGEIKRVVTSLLMQVDALPSYTVVIAASNHSELLDRAVWRRFQFRLELPAPTLTQVGRYFEAFAKTMDGPLGLGPNTIAKSLGDEEIEFEPDEDFFEPDARAGREGERRTDRPLGGRLYLAMPDVGALRQLLSLWNRWQRGEGLPGGCTPWRDVFASLREIRPWGPADRLSEETIARWREEFEDDPGEIRRIEVELWFRDSGASRAAAFRRVAEVVAAAGEHWFSTQPSRRSGTRRC